MRYVKVTLLQNAQSILTTFSAPLQAQAIRNFEATGIDVRLGVRVTAVSGAVRRAACATSAALLQHAARAQQVAASLQSRPGPSWHAAVAGDRGCRTPQLHHGRSAVAPPPTCRWSATPSP
jgi:hypothetical protein